MNDKVIKMQDFIKMNQSNNSNNKNNNQNKDHNLNLDSKNKSNDVNWDNILFLEDMFDQDSSLNPIDNPLKTKIK